MLCVKIKYETLSIGSFEKSSPKLLCYAEEKN